MRYLIDTNILCFLAYNLNSISRNVQDIFNDYNNRVYISSECVRELINLHQSDKIEAIRWKNARDIISFIIDEANIEIKYVKEEHLWTLADLPRFADHKDPSDRIIIAQAITEKIPIISSDRKFSCYEKYGLDFVFNKR